MVTRVTSYLVRPTKTPRQRECKAGKEACYNDHQGIKYGPSPGSVSSSHTTS